jgi:hypothetical protein
MTPQTIEPGDDVVLTINSQYGQYHIDAVTMHLDPWPTPTAGLFNGEEGWVGVLTGTAQGPVTSQVQYLRSSPSAVLEGWDMVGERDLVHEPRENPTRWGSDVITISETEGKVVAVLTAPPGRYRIRLHVRNRQEAHTRNDPTVAIENHLIQLWATESESPINILSELDTYAEAYQ